MKDGKTIAIVPGSFDPITIGHLDIICRAAESFDIVIVAVMINSSKQYMFNLEERTALATEAVRNISNVSVLSSEGFLWELCRDLSVDAIVKGYRNQMDFDYETEMAKYNEERYPEAKTILLESDPGFDNISSTLVREKIRSRLDIEQLIPPMARKKLSDIISEDKIK